MSETKRGLSHTAVELLLSIVETSNAVIAGPVLADYYGVVGNELQSHGLLTPNGHELTTASLADHDDVPVTVTWSADASGYGHFSANAGWVTVPADRLTSFRVDYAKLLQRVLARSDLWTRTAPTVLLPDLLWEIGELRMPGRGKPVPIWIARRLADPVVWSRFADTVRARPAPGLRIVLSLTPADRLPAHTLQGHSIIPVRDVADHASGLVVDPDLLAARVASGSQSNNALITVVADRASVTVRGQRYAFSGSKQRAVVRYLYEALQNGVPECLTAEVLEVAGFSGSVNTLAKAFSGREDWRHFIKEERGRCWMFH
jgi:hypothetical protein